MHNEFEDGEKDRFFSRLASIPGIRPMPSVGEWILIEVEEPSEFAARMDDALAPGLVSIPQGMDGAVRVPVGDPKDNELIFRTIRSVV